MKGTGKAGSKGKEQNMLATYREPRGVMCFVKTWDGMLGMTHSRTGIGKYVTSRA